MQVSIFERLTDAAHALDAARLLPAPAPEFEAAVRSVVTNIRECCALDSNAALAHLMIAEPLRYSLRHSTNAGILASLLLSRVHHDPARVEGAIAAALTMNLSIFDLQDTLYRQQAPLASDQRTAVRLHPVESVKILQNHRIEDPTWLRAVEQHHEARNGSGYPSGLKAPGILMEAQIVSLADQYCVLVSPRAHRPALSPRRAIEELQERAGAAIDPSLIGALIASVGVFPPGTYVRLANGETAIVTRRLSDAKHPTVYALHQDTGAAYETPKERSTASEPDFAIVADAKPETVRVRIQPAKLWPPSATS